MRKNLLFLLCCSRFIDKECFDGEQVNKETVSGTTSHSDFYHEYLQIYYRVFGGNCVFFFKICCNPSLSPSLYTTQVLNAMRARARAGHFQCRRGRGGKILLLSIEKGPVISEPQTQPDICRVSSRAAMAGDGGAWGSAVYPKKG